MKSFILALLISMASGSMVACNAWDLIKPQPGLAVDTELVVGDKHQTVNTALGETTNNADTITNISQGVPWWTTILLILGWVLDSPKVMWGRFKQYFKKGDK